MYTTNLDFRGIYNPLHKGQAAISWIWDKTTDKTIPASVRTEIRNAMIHISEGIRGFGKLRRRWRQDPLEIKEPDVEDNSPPNQVIDAPQKTS